VVMPSWSREKGMIVTEDAQHIHFYKCLLHSSVHVLDEQQATFARWERPGGRDKIEAALEGGHAFPWSALTALQAPKFLSDMVESLLGAVFLDSCGDLEVVRGVLRRLGHWEVLERIVERNTDVMHPLSRLNIWAGKNHERVKCGTPKRNENRVSCSVVWDDYEVARVEAEWGGRISREDVRFAVAEKAITLLEDPVSLLRIWLAKQNRSVEYSIEEAQGMRTCTVIVQGTEVARVVSRDLSASDEAKRAAAMEALKTLEVPVHWLDFLSIQHGFDVRYEIYEEEGTKVCCVHVDGFETGKVEYPIKGPGPAVTERDMMDAAARKAIVVLEQQVGYDELWKDADWGNGTYEDWE
jgi:endoribonuclease Dicer